MEEDYVMIPGSGTKMIIRDVKKEIETAFLDYSMSVIVGPRPAGRAGRPEAGPPPHPVHHA